MARKANGKLIIIGGHENKVGDTKILAEVSKDAKKDGGGIVIITVASSEPEAMAKEYIKAFKAIGLKKIEVMNLTEREQAKSEKEVEKLKEASVVFFTGGDQMRITSQVGDSLVYQEMQKMLQDGLTVAGTSAGAAAMPETMIIGGEGDQSNKISGTSMAPGLGLIQGVVVDSHFAERGRMGRLLGAVAENPKNIGLGIDENTAVVFEDDEVFRVVGSGAVYVVDGTDITYSSLSEAQPEGVISIFNVKLHVLSEGDQFNLIHRTVTSQSKAENQDGKKG